MANIAYIAVLTDHQIDDILAHLERSGGLVITGLTGSLDADGIPRSENRLLKTLGLCVTPAKAEALADQPEGWERWEKHC
ncbi:hypothetical protein FACS1894184_17640 [Clostridia bacterium]|nr:hypothetical protein FACS1894184_17640 [Clostridia bacterium]